MKKELVEIQPGSNTDALIDLIGEGKHILVFYATWCTPCKQGIPIFETMLDEYEGYKFHKIDIDQNKELVKEAGIEGWPAFVAMHDGEEMGRLYGFTTKEEFRENFNPYLEKSNQVDQE